MLRVVLKQTLPAAHRSPCSPRTFFTLPNLSSLLGNHEPARQTYHERKIFPYRPRELYQIVADVVSYPAFVPYCTGSRILTSATREDGVRVLNAELTVGFLAFKESYVSKVTCKPYESVQAVASSTTPLFKSLTTIWRFQPASPSSPHLSASFARHSQEQSAANVGSHTSSDSGPTLVTLDLAFVFANPAHAAVSTTFFGQVSKQMVKAFEERCIAVYGPGSS
ncbi:dehydrase and lipid transport-domain-containing protein [Phlebopus sp. FC_14]|nr:dehydrase and lipid transport-domain-containing protein [Phlebopus sp. FC_14]